jgi:acetoin utilization protein AcuB
VDHSKSRVKDWMTQQPLTVGPDTSAVEAYERMRDRKIHRLPVVDTDGNLVGIVTRSDIEGQVSFSQSTGGWAGARFALAGSTVGEMMTSNPITVTPTNSMRQAAGLLITHHLSGLPVVEEGKLVGIITETDVFRLVVELCED